MENAGPAQEGDDAPVRRRGYGVTVPEAWAVRIDTPSA